jgi:hypothetical protein
MKIIIILNYLSVSHVIKTSIRPALTEATEQVVRHATLLFTAIGIRLSVKLREYVVLFFALFRLILVEGWGLIGENCT